MVLQCSSPDLTTIRLHAEQAYPEECCGLLLGQLHRSADRKILVEIRPTQNAWDAAAAETIASVSPLASESLTKNSHYWIDPKEMLVGQRYARDRQLQIIGIYHSHPDHPAVPSECDRVCAWSQYSYMIVSVQQGIAQDLLCWSLDDQHQFQPETMLAIA